MDVSQEHVVSNVIKVDTVGSVHPNETVLDLGVLNASHPTVGQEARHRRVDSTSCPVDTRSAGARSRLIPPDAAFQDIRKHQQSRVFGNISMMAPRSLFIRLVRSMPVTWLRSFPPTWSTIMSGLGSMPPFSRSLGTRSAHLMPLTPTHSIWHSSARSGYSPTSSACRASQ